MSKLKNNSNSQTFDEEVKFKVTFSNTEEDFKAWYQFYIKNNINNTKRNTVLLIALYSILAFFIIAFLLELELEYPFLIAFIVSLASFIVLYLITPYLIVRRNLSLIKKIPELFSVRNIYFLEDLIEFRIEKDVVIKRYDSFKKIYETENYLFLMQNEIQAIIFPKKHFSKEQIDFIKSKISKN